MTKIWHRDNFRFLVCIISNMYFYRSILMKFIMAALLVLGQSLHTHYNDVIMGAMASQITSLTIVCSTVYSGTDKRKHQSSASLAFVRGIHRWPVNSPHKGPVTRKMFPFDDVIMRSSRGFIKFVKLENNEIIFCTYLFLSQRHLKGNSMKIIW